tara:strand:- start:1934 stop:2512 length:579 start_codon:yes stop_codon:yes gene_type:complete
MSDKKMKLLLERWQHYLNEADADVEGVPEFGQAVSLPEELFHPIKAANLSKIIEDGLRDFNEYRPTEAQESGIPFMMNFAGASDGKLGDAVLVFDGARLSESGDYQYRGEAEDEGVAEDEIRLFMRDEARTSGSGIDPKVDTLGTEVPFSYASRVVFLNPIQREELNHYKQTFPELPLAYYDTAKDEIVDYI